MEEAEMQGQGIVERSSIPLSSAVVLVKKKDRSLMRWTIKDADPLPRVEDMLDALVGKQWFRPLDLKSGYYQVRMAEENKCKTTSSFHQELW